MNNFLVGLALLLIAVFGALFAVPQFVDWNSYRGVIEEEASRYLGRDVRVGGNVGLRLLPTPSFRLEKIIVADHEAGSGEAFFRADMVSARLSIAPLLRGVLEANEIDLVAPQIHLVPGQKRPAVASPSQRLSDRLPFLPRDLALSSVRISDGVLVIDGTDRSERLRLTGIAGEVSAPALHGPYRFRGVYGDENARRDVRLSTTEADSDGSIRYKLAVKHLDTGATYALDARASNLAASMRSDGEFTAEIPAIAIDRGAKSPARMKPDAKSDTDASDGKSDQPALEVKAAMTADTDRVKLANLTATVENQGRPQTLTGEAEYDLGSGESRIALASRWLDLDKLTGLFSAAAGERGPLLDLVALMARANSIGADRNASLTLAVDQATLGQEPVSGLALSLVSMRGTTDVRELRIGLPGGGRADFTGRISGSGDNMRYDGDASMRGTSLARLLTWATTGGFKLDPARDAPYAIRARLDATATNIRARDMVAEIAGTTGQGEIELGLGQRRSLAVTIEGEQVDLRLLLNAAAQDGGTTPGTTPGPIRRNPILSALAAASSAGVKIENVDSRLRLRATRILTPDGIFTDAVADLEWLNRNLRIAQLKFDAGDGVSLDVEGDLTDLSASPRGTLRGTVAAETAQGVAVLAGLSAWPPAMRPTEPLAAAIAPLRIAGTVSIGEAGAVDIAGDGTTANAAIKVRSRFDRGIAQWKSAGLDLSLAVDGPDAERVARALTGHPASPSAPQSSRSRLTLRTSGTAADGLATYARIERAGSQASFTGRVTALDPIKASGDVQWSSPDGADLQSLLPDLPRVRMEGVATRGAAKLDYTAAAITLSRIDASIDERAMSGNLSLVKSGETTKITGALDADTATVAGLLRPWTEPPARRGTALADATAVLNAATPVGAWPQAVIDLSGARSEGTLQLRTRRLDVTQGLALHDASMRLMWRPGRADVVDLVGRAGNGNWTGSFALEPAAPASKLTGIIRGKGVRFDQLLASGTTRPPATGSFDVMLTASGKGNTLRDMVSDLAGSGTVELIGGSINALSPTAVHVALETAMTGPADGMIPRLKEQLDAAMRRPAQPTELKSARVPLELTAGVIATKPLLIETPQGRAATSLRVDLPAASIAGEWRIERLTIANVIGTPGKAPSQPLPPLTVSIAGPLSALASLPASLDSEALEREITVRKIERDVEELERLRRLDEERAAQERAAQERAAKERAKEEAARTAQPIAAQPIDAPPSPAATPVEIAVPLPIAPEPASTGTPSTQPLIPPVPAEATRPRPAPQPKPAFRPYNAEEQRKLFGNGSGG